MENLEFGLKYAVSSYGFNELIATIAIPVRQILYGKRGGAYRVLFQIIGDVVFILHVRHAAMADVEP
ncbi:MAG: hypothetical protein HYR55_04460 [Acidobacteria bacterium]|nr:hypothetical protein [Acidobacteriota bacterium]